MKLKKTQIIVPVPKLYSVGDEDHFFKWLYSLRAYKEVVGAGTELCISFRTTKLSKNDRLELIALFSRYGLDKRVLRPFLGSPSEWSPKISWFKEVFR